jgi:predicted acyl esterase
MRRIFACVVLALALLAAPLRAEDAPWTAEQTAVAIPTRDKASLAADVFLPATPGKYPAVVVQTPYDRTLMRLALRGVGERGVGERGPWDREHYAYVVVDWRGFFGSKNAGRVGATRRGLDGFDVVEWTAAQSWCDGKVGTWGPSALGRIQLDTAQEAPPHLVCCVPLVAPIGQRYEDYYEGGVFKEAHAEKLDALGFNVSRLVAAAPLPDAPAWKLAAATEHVERMNVPMFFITGWYDHATARELESFRTLLEKGGPRAREGSKLLVGPWTHTGIDQAKQGDLSFDGAAGEAARETRLFFDFHLRGQTESNWTTRPRVRTWRINEDGWTGADAWPPNGAARATLTLHADGLIDAAAPTADEPTRKYVDDPASPVETIGGANLPAKYVTVGPRDQAPLLSRDDVLVYTTAALGEPLRLDGVASVRVALRADRPSVDVAVRLCEVLADGRTILVADSIQRVTPMADGTAAVDVEMPPLAVTIPKDGRLRLIVAGSNWPRYERNPHTGAPHYDPAKSASAKVEVVSGSLELPPAASVKAAAPETK